MEVLIHANNSCKLLVNPKTRDALFRNETQGACVHDRLLDGVLLELGLLRSIPFFGMPPAPPGPAALSEKEPTILWMVAKSISHHFETMGNHRLLGIYRGTVRNQAFLGDFVHPQYF